MMKKPPSFSRSAWERKCATLRVAAGSLAGRDAERPDVRSHAGAWEREAESAAARLYEVVPSRSHGPRENASVRRSASRLALWRDGTQSVRTCVPTQERGNEKQNRLRRASMK